MKIDTFVVNLISQKYIFWIFQKDVSKSWTSHLNTHFESPEASTNDSQYHFPPDTSDWSIILIIEKYLFDISKYLLWSVVVFWCGRVICVGGAIWFHRACFFLTYFLCWFEQEMKIKNIIIEINDIKMKVNSSMIQIVGFMSFYR